MLTVDVPVPGRPYRVHVGRRLPVAKIVRDALGRDVARRTHVVADARVLQIHGVPRGLSAHAPIPLAPGEARKTLRAAEGVLRALARRAAGRDALVVALGGGMTSDLAGLVASLHGRGVAFAIVPTTLLGMVDAAIGGKTGVNLPEGKNLAGTFHQPRVVVVDAGYLESLAPRELRSGWVELVKAAILEGGEAWDAVCARPDPTAMRADLLVPLVAKAIAFKAAVVAEDERESGRRAILNLGHTLAHALETATRYRHYRHGEAVAAGMLFAAELSRSLVGFPSSELGRLQRVVRPLCRRPPAGLRLSDLEPLLARDKKSIRGAVRWVLLRRPGESHVVSDVPRAALSAAFAALARDGVV